MLTKFNSFIKLAKVSRASSHGIQQIFYYPLNTFVSQPRQTLRDKEQDLNKNEELNKQEAINVTEDNLRNNNMGTTVERGDLKGLKLDLEGRRSKVQKENVNAEQQNFTESIIPESKEERLDMRGLKKDMDPSARGPSKVVSGLGNPERLDLKGIRGETSAQDKAKTSQNKKGRNVREKAPESSAKGSGKRQFTTRRDVRPTDSAKDRDNLNNQDIADKFANQPQQRQNQAESVNKAQNMFRQETFNQNAGTTAKDLKDTKSEMDKGRTVEEEYNYNVDVHNGYARQEPEKFTQMNVDYGAEENQGIVNAEMNLNPNLGQGQEMRQGQKQQEKRRVDENFNERLKNLNLKQRQEQSQFVNAEESEKPLFRKVADKVAETAHKVMGKKP